MLAVPAAAQNEAALRAFFEGKRVTLKIDMPGTSDGVDVRADARRALDYQRHGDRLKTYGTAIHNRESATVTLIKVKKDLIEFQLNGGGFGTFGDDASTSVSLPYVEKSRRERELEKWIDDETDPRRKRELRRELDELRDRRERENRRIDVERARLEEIKRQRIADERLQGGSRFNLRYSDEVPSGIRPEEVMAALADYVDFSPLSAQTSAPSFPRVEAAPVPGRETLPTKRHDACRGRATVRQAGRIVGSARRVARRQPRRIRQRRRAHYRRVRRRRPRPLHDCVQVAKSDERPD